MKPLQAIKARGSALLGCAKDRRAGDQGRYDSGLSEVRSHFGQSGFNRTCGVADLAATNHRVELAERQFNHVVRLDDVYLPLS